MQSCFRMIAVTVITALLGFNQGLCDEVKTEDINEHSEALMMNHAEDPQGADVQRLSEAFGHFIGSNLTTPGFTFDLESIIKGMRNGAAGNPSPMSEEEYEAALSSIQQQTFVELANANLIMANNFLKANAQVPHVVVIEDGKLQYEVIQTGEGAELTIHDTPMLHYMGKFMDGTIFGSSADVGGPITISLDQTIPGFSKGIVGMKEGEKRRIYVHPDLGYGDQGELPPNSLLMFEVEIVSISPTPSFEDSLLSADKGTDHNLETDDEVSMEFSSDSNEEELTIDLLSLDELEEEITTDQLSPDEDKEGISIKFIVEPSSSEVPEVQARK